MFPKRISSLATYHLKRKCVYTFSGTFSRNLMIDPSMTGSSINETEIKHFDNLASNWWDKEGPMKALHTLNTIRVPFIREGLKSTNVVHKDHTNTSMPLKGLEILEIGCGAGVLTEQLARIHANVTGIDPSDGAINAAKEHLKESSELSKRVTYVNETVEEHSKYNANKYDAVVVSEVLEHVNNKNEFLKSCIVPLKIGGSIFITTFHKTYLSYVTAIIIAENLVKIVPQNTHNWNNFITPLETQKILDEHGCSTILVNGFLYEFWKNKWRWIPTNKMSYALQGVKVR